MTLKISDWLDDENEETVLKAVEVIYEKLNIHPGELDPVKNEILEAINDVLNNNCITARK